MAINIRNINILKEKAIRQAYESFGMDWNQIKNLVNDIGVLILSTPDLKQKIKGYDNLIADKDKFSAFGNEGLKICPSSLKGLYNNNGWRIIEYENNFPETDLEYKIGKMLNGKFYISNGVYDKEEVLLSFSENKITHYKPLEEPKPPIY